MRWALLLPVILLAGGCTFFFEVQESAQPDPAPGPEQQRVIFAEVRKITSEMKAAGPSEISDVGPNEAQSGPENWTVCSRASFAGEMRYFSFFVRGDKVVTWRPAVINDRCEARRYGPMTHGG
jgi:hypothetical protein